mgnify:CR=1 FL=1
MQTSLITDVARSITMLTARADSLSNSIGIRCWRVCEFPETARYGQPRGCTLVCPDRSGWRGCCVCGYRPFVCIGSSIFCVGFDSGFSSYQLPVAGDTYLHLDAAVTGLVVTVADKADRWNRIASCRTS